MGYQEKYQEINKKNKLQHYKSLKWIKTYLPLKPCKKCYGRGYLGLFLKEDNAETDKDLYQPCKCVIKNYIRIYEGGLK